MAERFNAPVLKTGGGNTSEGSNPSLSAMNYIVYMLDKGAEVYYNEFAGWMLDIHSATLYNKKEAKNCASTLNAYYKTYGGS